MSLFQLITKRLPFPAQLFFIGLLPGLPWLGVTLYEHLKEPLSDRLLILFFAIYVFGMLGLLMFLWRICHEPFHALANLVRSLYQGDYTQRTTGYGRGDAVGELYEEINILADILQNNRFAVVESMRQFQYLIDQLDIGVLAFDERQQLTMLNHYLARSFGKTPSDLMGESIKELSLEALEGCKSGRMLWLEFPNKSSRFLIHSSQFREDGRPQHLYLLTDVQDPLRDEERTAWKRLIRVMGHELNNSLTPIISLSQSLKSRIASIEATTERKDSSIEALEIICNRAQGLNRFIDDYAKLAKLPEPARIELDLYQCLQEIVSFIGIHEIEITEGVRCSILVDRDQTEQMLINVLHNAKDALPDEGGLIKIHWIRDSTDAVLYIDDNGEGIENGENLFVPFYSTKPKGSGIGLVLCRQIAEAMGGSIDLSNLSHGGCRVTIHIPLSL